MRMLFQPATGNLFLEACEADGHRGLVAAILDDPTYETAAVEDRLQRRLRLAHDLVLLEKLKEHRVTVGDRDSDNTINVHSDREFIESLERIGFLSLARGARG